MKRSILRVRKILPLTLIVFVLSIIIASVGTASPTPIITQTSSTTTVYLDPPTINGTAIGVGNTVTVSVMIRDAPDMMAWQAGMIFNPDVLECTGFYEGEFLKNVGPTQWITPAGKPPFNNTAGVINTHGCTLQLPSPGQQMPYASGNGRLAYANFTVIALGVSDLHLKDVKPSSWKYVGTTATKIKIPTNIIDIYTVVVGTTSHTVAIVSNSTGTDRVEIGTELVEIGSGFSGHSFNLALKEISFNVTGPYLGFSQVTIPKALLIADPPRVWTPVVNGTRLGTEERTVTENDTHTSIYFTYVLGVNNVHITARFMPSTISIALSEDSIPRGSSVTLSGNVTAADNTMRENVNVTIQSRKKGDEEWALIGNTTTDSNGIYSYDWKPNATGTYDVKASWEGDEETLGDESDVQTLKVKGEPGFPLWIVIVAVVAIIVIAAVAVYFVKFRKK